MSEQPSPANNYYANHVSRLCGSYERLLGRALVAAQGSPNDQASAVYNAEFVVLSSGLEADPLFNYANRTGLNLFELDWPSLIKLPARESAEADLQEKRERLMQRVRDNGFIEDYAGVRISASGRRFTIEAATVWNVIDDDGEMYGQAATFKTWRHF